MQTKKNRDCVTKSSRYYPNFIKDLEFDAERYINFVCLNLKMSNKISQKDIF